MEIEIQLTGSPIAEKISPPQLAAHGAWLEFRGAVRDEENGVKISALEYEAYAEMAVREIRRLLEALSPRHFCLAAKVIHRIGIVPAGEAAIYVGIASRHRAEAIALLGEFMNGLKQAVPIWKRRALPANFVGDEVTSLKSKGIRNQPETPHVVSYNSKIRSLDEAMAEIQSRCESLPAVRVSLEESFGRVLRETVCAPEDLPPVDRSTRDGYAVLSNDESEAFFVVDTIHAADWKPRQLKSGETVRVATGATLPCDGLRVAMQENVERNGDQIRIIKREAGLNLRKRGEDVKAGQPLVQSGVRLDAGKLALLATAGCAQPLVNPRLRVAHFTTGDEIIPPEQMPKPGQIRDSNSILIRGLLQNFPCDVTQKHLPENFESAKSQITNHKSQIENADVLLVSGGASVGDKDFTRPLLEWLGFEIVFSQVNVRPGRPLIFGVNGNRITFGLPGNPLSHFVCFHLFVAVALAKLTGQETPGFFRGKLAENLEDAPCPRETLWPARLEFTNGELRLRPLKWSSSGDITCLTETNALIRVPMNQGSIETGAAVDFLPTQDSASSLSLIFNLRPARRLSYDDCI
ncbi:MAG TPA: molybdopterin-binding protein [Verrucomicrobiae bacterium]